LIEQAPEGLLEIGHIRRAHGLHGQVSVELLTDRHERLASGARWYARESWLTVVEASPHQNRWLVRFAEIADRTAAQRYTNVAVYAEPLEDPEALWVHELVGSDVVERDGRARGTCVAVVANPAADLLELDSGALVPVVFVTEHSPARIVIDPPAGLFELAD
jgi:16S rRNA processing protein RimM